MSRKAELLIVPQLSDPLLDLLDSMAQSDHIAARGFCRVAGRVLRTFRLVHSQQKVSLLSQTFDCRGLDLFFKRHILYCTDFPGR